MTKISAIISNLIDCFICYQIIPRYLITLSKARWCGGHFKDSLSRGADTRACNLSVLTLYHPSWNGLPQIKKYNISDHFICVCTNFFFYKTAIQHYKICQKSKFVLVKIDFVVPLRNKFYVCIYFLIRIIHFVLLISRF